jgi:hypothetical protein
MSAANDRRMRLFSYKITRDYGFAPNPFHGVCTLATCKPQIRSAAQPGDIVVGCGSAANGLAGRAICVLRVTGKCSFQQFWDDPRFRLKKPFFGGSRSSAYGDNIYHRTPAGEWVQERSHHSFADGALNFANLHRDTGSDNVLWSTDFSYFGADAVLIPAGLRDFHGEDLSPTNRSHRCVFSPEFIGEVEDWFASLPRNVQGRPTAWR